MSAIDSYLPRFNGQVLITSRHIQWPGTSISVNAFEPEEAKAYIKNILGKEIAKKEHDCEQLAKVMGYLPLALAQACAHVKENPITLKNYLKLYERKRQALLSSPLMPKGDKHLPVYISWDITIDKIKTKLKSSIAEQLLMFCAYLNHSGIPKKLLTTYLSQNKIEDEIEQIEILGLLTNYSLLTFEPNTKSYSIHPVMQEVLILKQTSELQIKYLKQVINLLLNYYPYIGTQLKDITLKRKLILHLEMIINKIEKGTLNLFSDTQEKEEAIINLSTILADAYFTIRDFSKQKEWLEKVLPIQERIYSKDSYHLEVTLTNLANAYGGLGDLKKQEVLLKKALDIHHKNSNIDPNEKVLGLVTILLNMSNSYYKFNNLTKKIELLQQALNIQLEHNMQHKPTWAMTLMNLGSAYASSGQIKEALKLLEKALELHEDLYGNKHPTFAVNARELGIAYLKLGNIEKGKMLLEQALDIQKGFYGKKHPEIVSTLINFGQLYKTSKEFLKAKKYLTRALEIQRELYKREHPNDINILMKLADIYYEQQNIEEATSLANQAYNISINCYGHQHSFTEKIKEKLNQYQSEIKQSSKILL